MGYFFLLKADFNFFRASQCFAHSKIWRQFEVGDNFRKVQLNVVRVNVNENSIYIDQFVVEIYCSSKVIIIYWNFIVDCWEKLFIVSTGCVVDILSTP